MCCERKTKFRLSSTVFNTQLDCFTGGSLSNLLFTKLLIQLIATKTHNYNPSIKLRFLIVSPCPTLRDQNCVTFHPKDMEIQCLLSVVYFKTQVENFLRHLFIKS